MLHADNDGGTVTGCCYGTHESKSLHCGFCAPGDAGKKGLKPLAWRVVVRCHGGYF